MSRTHKTSDPDSLICDFTGGAVGHRFRYGGGRDQALPRAVGMKDGKTPMVVDAMPNAEWSLDFMSDALYQGKRRFRTLNVLDEGVREILAIVIDTSIPGGRVVRTLEQLVDWRGKPLAIRVDNGPEFVSQVFVEWCKANGIELCYIQPGKPNQNAFIERFNRTYRHEVLDAYVFESLQQVRQLTAQWMKEYNEERPHESLGQIPPAMFRRQLEIAENSSYELPH